MYASCAFAPLLLPLLYIQPVIAALIPSLISTPNETLVRLPNVSVVEASPVAVVTSGPLSFRTILLAFYYKGQPIPRSEVEDTFASAEQAIIELVEQHPNQDIPNGRFEYRRRGGDMLIVISANVGDWLTWNELDRALIALFRYMSAGIGITEEHYQALEFDVETEDHQAIGRGLVWYYGSGSSRVQKRVAFPTLTSTGNGTLHQLPNSTSSLQSSKSGQDPIPYPIPWSTLNLNFYFLGPPIESKNVDDTLQGALSQVRPWVEGPYQNAPIDADGFQWVLPYSPEVKIRVAVTVFADHLAVSWKQLYDILTGLQGFITNVGTDLRQQHYQVLGFRIDDMYKGRLGVGTLAFYTPGIGEIEKRAGVADGPFTSSTLSTTTKATPIRVPSTMDSSQSSATAANFVKWPIPGTDIDLTFTLLGDAIPQLEIIGLIEGAQRNILIAVQNYPDSPITSNRFQFSTGSGYTLLNIIAYREKTITWLKLSQILAGILEFCSEGDNRALVFEIDIGEQGRVGFGTLLFYHPLAGEMAKRKAGNATLSSSAPLTVTTSIPYDIPQTPITLVFEWLGTPIPSFEVTATLTTALRKISSTVARRGNQPIPGNVFDYRDNVNDIGIFFGIYPYASLAWRELSDILVGMLQWMTGAGEDGHCVDLAFRIKLMDIGTVGTGSIWYGIDPGTTEVQKRAKIANEASILPNTTYALPSVTPISPISNTSLEMRMPFPIPDTPIIIVFTDVGPFSIPLSRIGDLFGGAKHGIAQAVNQKPNDPITEPLWEYIATYSRRSPSPEVVSLSLYTGNGNPLSWYRLNQVLEFLDTYISVHTVTTVFDINLVGGGLAAKGILWYYPGRPADGTALEKRAWS
ncbi:hypothetical protein MMC28_008860 [Mycoblastus sanguinarius]|nr:hypothetical protein [Mycoblastus sanguinarius]